MTQPLTDAINALTTYANTVTGKTPPDTTLSDAVATLASGYGQGGGYNALYPIALTTYWSYADYTARDNHIRLDFKAIRNGYYYLNFSQRLEGTTQAVLNGKEKQFTIPANSTCVFSIKNFNTNISEPLSMNFRKALTNQQAGFGTGELSGDTSVTVQVDTALDMGILYGFMDSTPNTGYIEFDVEFTVNGIRYI